MENNTNKDDQYESLLNHTTNLLAVQLKEIQLSSGVSDGIIICSLTRVLGMVIAISPEEHKAVIRKSINNIIDQIDQAYTESTNGESDDQ